MVEMVGWGHELVCVGWQSIRIVGASACVIFILHQKIQKMAKCIFWYWLTWVVPDKVQRSTKWLLCSGYCKFDCQCYRCGWLQRRTCVEWWDSRCSHPQNVAILPRFQYIMCHNFCVFLLWCSVGVSIVVFVGNIFQWTASYCCTTVALVLLSRNLFFYECAAKKYPLLQTLYCDHREIFVHSILHRNLLISNDEYQLSACRGQSFILLKRNSISPCFAVFQHKLSMMSQNRNDCSSPRLCSVGSKFTRQNVLFTELYLNPQWSKQ